MLESCGVDAGRPSGCTRVDPPLPSEILSASFFKVIIQFAAMNPVAAFSLARGVLQFLEFSSTIVSKFWSCYRSNRQASTEVPDLVAINSSLQCVLRDKVPANDGKYEESGLSLLAHQCQDVALELDNLLQSFQKVDALSVGTQEAIVAAKKPQIQYLTSRLVQLQKTFVMDLLVLIRLVAPLLPDF